MIYNEVSLVSSKKQIRTAISSHGGSPFGNTVGKKKKKTEKQNYLVTFLTIWFAESFFFCFLRSTQFC